MTRAQRILDKMQEYTEPTANKIYQCNNCEIVGFDEDFNLTADDKRECPECDSTDITEYDTKFDVTLTPPEDEEETDPDNSEWVVPAADDPDTTEE